MPLPKPPLSRRILVNAGLVIGFIAALILLARYALARRVEKLRTRG